MVLAGLMGLPWEWDQKKVGPMGNVNVYTEELVPSRYQLWTNSADVYLTYPLRATHFINHQSIYQS
jgi:hypothetical protein